MLELHVAYGAMDHITNADPEQVLINLGVTPETLKLVKGTIPWTVANRIEVVRCLDALNHGVCDIVGIPKIALPAEYIAASIAKFVHPLNTQVACSWMEVKSSAMEIASSNSKPMLHEEITAQQLFSLVMLLQSNNVVDVMSARFKQAVQDSVEAFMASAPA